MCIDFFFVLKCHILKCFLSLQVVSKCILSPTNFLKFSREAYCFKVYLVSANPKYTPIFKRIPCLKVERKQDTNYFYDNVDAGMIILILKLNL